LSHFSSFSEKFHFKFILDPELPGSGITEKGAGGERQLTVIAVLELQKKEQGKIINGNHHQLNNTGSGQRFSLSFTIFSHQIPGFAS
jgi:hypothetical protein